MEKFSTEISDGHTWTYPPTGIGSKCLMRPFVVVLSSECIELLLLKAKRLRRRTQGFLLERPVHSFVSSILLGVPRLDALVPNAELDPPDRQPRQAACSSTREGRSVVRSNALGQPQFTEGVFENRPCVSSLCRVERRAPQQHPTICVRDRQRIATPPITGLEFALEVGAPNSIGSVGIGERIDVGRSPSTWLA